MKPVLVPSEIVHYPDYKYRREYLAHLKENNLFSLNQLTGEVRKRALIQVYESQMWWMAKYHQDTHEYIKEFGIHKFINKNKRCNLTKKIVNSSMLNKRLRNEPKYFEAFVLDNLQEFYADGTLFTHFPELRKLRSFDWN